MSRRQNVAQPKTCNMVWLCTYPFAPHLRTSFRELRRWGQKHDVGSCSASESDVVIKSWCFRFPATDGGRRDTAEGYGVPMGYAQALQGPCVQPDHNLLVHRRATLVFFSVAGGRMHAGVGATAACSKHTCCSKKNRHYAHWCP